MSASTTGITLTATVRFEQTFDYANVRVSFLAFDADGYTGFTPGGLQNLDIYCQMNRVNDDRFGFPAYAWEYSYRQCWSINLERAKDMVKTLTKLERSLAQVEERDGRCTTYGQYVHRICRALGVEQVLLVPCDSCAQSDAMPVSYRDLAADIDNRIYAKAQDWHSNPWHWQ